VGNGKAVVFVAIPRHGDSNDGNIVWRSLVTSQQHVVVAGGNRSTILADGDLVIAPRGALLHLPFDPVSGTVRGTLSTIVDEVATSPDQGVVQYDISKSGTLVYVPPAATSMQTNFVWVDRNGLEQKAFVLDKPTPTDFALSPDGKRVALTTGDTNRNVWVTALTVERSLD
jgi:hypothetical protein